MTSRRMITSILTVLVVAAPAAVPALATAGSLLSGYGGPGQGNQAILGSALLNGPSGGGGGGGSAGAGGSAGSGTLAVTSSPVTSSRPQGSRARHGHAAAGHHASGQGAPGATTPGVTGSYPLSAGLARAVSGDSGTLGLSGADLLYILLALAALALTGLATRQLIRGHEGQEGTVAKGMRQRIRGTE
jgi:hypothetical protein